MRSTRRARKRSTRRTTTRRKTNRRTNNRRRTTRRTNNRRRTTRRRTTRRRTTRRRTTRRRTTRRRTTRRNNKNISDDDRDDRVVFQVGGELNEMFPQLGFNYLKHLVACRQEDLEGINLKHSVPQLVVPLLPQVFAKTEKEMKNLPPTYVHSSGDFLVDCADNMDEDNMDEGYSDIKRNFQGGSIFHVKGEGGGLSFVPVNAGADEGKMDEIKDKTGGALKPDDKDFIKNTCCSGDFVPLNHYFETFFSLFGAGSGTELMMSLGLSPTLAQGLFYLIKSEDNFHLAFYGHPLTIENHGEKEKGNYVMRFFTSNLNDPRYYDNKKMSVRYFFSETGEFPTIKEFAQAELMDIFGTRIMDGVDRPPVQRPGRRRGAGSAGGGSAGGGSAGGGDDALSPSMLMLMPGGADRGAIQNMNLAKRYSAAFYGDQFKDLTSAEKISDLTMRPFGDIQVNRISLVDIQATSIDAEKQFVCVGMVREESEKLITAGEGSCFSLLGPGNIQIGILFDVGFSNGCKILVEERKKGKFKKNKKVYIVSPQHYDGEREMMMFNYFNSGEVGKKELQVWERYENSLIRDMDDDRSDARSAADFLRDRSAARSAADFLRDRSAAARSGFGFLRIDFKNTGGYIIPSNDQMRLMVKVFESMKETGIMKVGLLYNANDTQVDELIKNGSNWWRTFRGGRNQADVLKHLSTYLHSDASRTVLPEIHILPMSTMAKGGGSGVPEKTDECLENIQEFLSQSGDVSNGSILLSWTNQDEPINRLKIGGPILRRMKINNPTDYDKTIVQLQRYPSLLEQNYNSDKTIFVNTMLAKVFSESEDLRSIFGDSVQEGMDFFHHATARLVELGALTADGIFRVSGSTDAVDEMMSNLVERNLPPQDILGACDDVNDVAMFLSRWLRKQPMMIPEDRFPECSSLVDTLLGQDPMRRPRMCEEFVGSLPEPGQRLLREVIGFLQGVDGTVTRMTPENLAVVFAPTLIYRADPIDIVTNAGSDASFVSLLIEHLPKSLGSEVMDESIFQVGAPIGDIEPLIFTPAPKPHEKKEDEVRPAERYHYPGSPSHIPTWTLLGLHEPETAE